MSDPGEGDAPDGHPAVQRRPAGEVVTQAEIEDVLNDERLSTAERQLRLADLRQRILDDEYADGEEEYAPLQARIMDALSMLADGGHDYSGTAHVEGERNEGENQV